MGERNVKKKKPPNIQGNSVVLASPARLERAAFRLGVKRVVPRLTHTPHAIQQKPLFYGLCEVVSPTAQIKKHLNAVSKTRPDLQNICTGNMNRRVYFHQNRAISPPPIAQRIREAPMLDAEDTKSGLAGAVFEIRDTSGRLFDTITTGAKGYSTPPILSSRRPRKQSQHHRPSQQRNGRDAGAGRGYACRFAFRLAHKGR